MRGSVELWVDQTIQHRLHVNIGLDDFALLKRDAGCQDQLVLGGADLGVRQLGALELLGDDGCGQFGGGDEVALQLFRIGECQGPGLLVRG